jgi:poly-gamma-glutamate synthesis protein (capsule biosynthesis protein)
MARIGLVGDVMLGRKTAETLAERPAEHPWGDVRDRLKAADLTLGNLECALCEGGTAARKRFTFRCPPEDGVPALEAGGFDGVALANNHVLDFGPEGLVETLEALEGSGIAAVGAGRDESGAWQPATLEAGSLRVAVMGLTDNGVGWAAGPSSPGTAYVPVDPERDAYDELRGRVRRVAPTCDLLVVGAHWGPNDRRHPPDEFRTFARGVLEAGADVFWGHSAHIFQGVERREEGVILYDTGDFVDDYRVDPETRNDLSFLFEVEASRDGVGEVVLTPTAIDPKARQVNRADGDEARWAVDKMTELCQGFGTAVEELDGPELRVPPDQEP